MDDLKLKQFIKEHLLTHTNKINSNRLKEEWFNKSGFASEYAAIQNATGNNITQQIYSIMYDTNIPLCKTCKITPVKFKNFQYGYLEYCSCKCASNSKEKKSKIEQTNIQKYGTTNPAKSNLIKEKTKETNLKKYGVEHVLQSSVIKDKIKNSNISKYGVENNTQKNIPQDALEKLNDAEWLINEHHTKQKTIKRIAEELSVTKRTVLNYLKKYNIESKRFTCSTGEKELVEFLTNYTIVETNKRNIIAPQEIDIFLPEYNIGIEYNGLYWHSDQKKPKCYHINKTLLCKNKNITLVHVFEDEWIYKKDIVKSILLSKLGIYTKRLYARNCTLLKLNNKEIRTFIGYNHIQGNTKAKDYYCLFHNNELVSVASVGKNRFHKDSYELIRYCNKLNYSVIGGFSKLLSAIKQDYTQLYSYTDLRYFNGSIYQKFGTFLKTTEPGYFWTNSIVRISRYKTQKNKLHKIIKTPYDPSLSESMIMRNNGYNKIYDCGNNLYLL